jgi:hypothetical protein
MYEWGFAGNFEPAKVRTACISESLREAGFLPYPTTRITPGVVTIGARTVGSKRQKM